MNTKVRYGDASESSRLEHPKRGWEKDNRADLRETDCKGSYRCMELVHDLILVASNIPVLLSES